MNRSVAIIFLVACASAQAGCYFGFGNEGDDDSGVGNRDGGFRDSGPRRDSAPVPDAFTPYEVEYNLLSETGLFSDVVTLTPSVTVTEFEPVYKLWSDNALKRRFIYLPPGEQIDNSDQDHWRFPPHTKVWKTFSRETIDGTVLLETRLIERTGLGNSNVYMMAFQWRTQCFDDNVSNDGECDADPVPAGVENVNGTTHDIPKSTLDCRECHAGEPTQILGFSAIQLSHPTPSLNCSHNMNGVCPSALSLWLEGRLTHEVPTEQFPVPGTGNTQQALGYLHANCGHCHQPNNNALVVNQCYTNTGGSPADGIEGFHSRVYVADTSAESTSAWLTTFGNDGCGMPLQYWTDETNPSCTPTDGGFDCSMDKRAEPGNAPNSAIYFRMQSRLSVEQMPYVGTELSDPNGIQTVTDWINSVAPGGSCP